MATSPRDRDLIRAQRYASAIRAFHTGLIAETQRHLRVLHQMADHIDVLRHPDRTIREKVVAAHAAYDRVRALQSLKRPWRETFRDFRVSLRRARTIWLNLARARDGRAKRLR